MNGSPALGKINHPYYVVPKGQLSGYWRPNKRMRDLGFTDVRCGKDGPNAWAIADQWTERWRATREGRLPTPASDVAADKETAEMARVYPPGSVGAAFQRYIKTDEWKKRPISTRQKELWPAWFRIRSMWGDVSPNTITFEMLSDWRGALEREHGLNVSHKALKFWRKLWTIMVSMRIAVGEDPSKGVVNTAPPERWQTWSEGEAVILAKTAIRRGFLDLAAIIAVIWDTQFQPGDARTLRGRHVAWIGPTKDRRLVFDKRAEGRQKTAKAVIGTLSRRAQRLVLEVAHKPGVELTDDAFLFRNRSGEPYRDDALADDFAMVREFAFPGDQRQMRDMRRAGTVEAVAGGARGEDVGAKMGNSIQRSNKLWKTYSPLEIEPVLRADEYRRAGRKRIRERTKDGQKVTSLQPIELHGRKSEKSK